MLDKWFPLGVPGKGIVRIGLPGAFVEVARWKHAWDSHDSCGELLDVTTLLLRPVFGSSNLERWAQPFEPLALMLLQTLGCCGGGAAAVVALPWWC